METKFDSRTYEDKLKEGLEYQDFVFDKLYALGIPLISYSSKKYQIQKGENKAGIEIKFDKRLKYTGNLYIETSEKSSAKNISFVSSGIRRDDNTWLYAIGDYETIYIFAKKHLLACSEKFRKVKIPTSRGFLLPLEYAKKLATRIIKC